MSYIYNHFVWGPRVRPGTPFFLLRSHYRYSINNRWQTFNSSFCAVTTDIDQKTFFSFQVVLYICFIHIYIYIYITTFFYRSTRTMTALVYCAKPWRRKYKNIFSILKRRFILRVWYVDYYCFHPLAAKFLSIKGTVHEFFKVSQY